MTVAIGPVGLWAPVRLWANAGTAAPDLAAEIEEAGFDALWLGNGPDVLATLTGLVAATRRLPVATGVLNVTAHPPTEALAAWSELAGPDRDRVLLGLGGGWPAPYAGMSRYLDALDTAPLPVPAASRVLGALGPKMLELAARRGAGAHPFLVTPEHTRWAREILGYGPLLAPEQKVVLERDPATARDIARRALDFYLTKRNYAVTLLRLGFTEDDLAGGGSDRLVDALVAWGDVDAVVARIHDHHLAGADHVAVQPLTADTDFIAPERRRLPVAQYRRLAEALTTLSR
ncbi:MAG: TIGR03620 family F420-dependent LLM class oxidoreductase [Mycobacteriales bacterium]